ncbi:MULTISPECIES: prepilin peptidase [Nocardiopsidaceae]|uniref:A24 family peptidase n=1 Tax=Streptomonospora nanhaiensis TaxID=1323731 RepID=A0ABY6YID2_9ACTN|nr:A24 family peptidase [Streptomonospora nanhaiensis]WAE72035.1 A24 family peptidase [Streptomonospora nanhaiensis]
MPTPAVLASSPYLWTVLVAVPLALLGLAVGRLNGRVVPLFGPAGPPRPRGGPGAVPVPAEGPPGAGRDDAGAEPGATGGGPRPGTAEEEDEGPPPPRCPHCLAEIRFLPGLPAVEARAFRRRGACPHCERAIRSDPAVIAATAVLFGLVGAVCTLGPDLSPFGLLAVLWLVSVGVPLSVIDLRVMRLPDAVVAPAYPVAAALLGASVLLPPSGPDPGRAADALLSMVFVTVVYWLLWRVHRGGIGFGDVKLSGLTGLYAGWAAGPLGALVAVFWAFAAFSLVGLALMALRRLTRRDPYPLGPFMLAATLATVLVGQPLLP